VIGKIMESLYNGETHYVDVPGHPELRKQIGAYLSDEGISQGGKVLITAGIQEARFLILQVLGKTLGKIMFPEVVHPGVRRALAVRNLDHGFIPVEAGPAMLASPETIQDALSDSGRVLYIESPSRFSGACYGKTELDEIVAQCRKQDVALIVDAGLHALIEGPRNTLSCCVEIDDRIFVIGEAWPGGGIDDLYLGYILTSEDMVKKIATQKQVISICTSAPSQNGAIAVGSGYRQKNPEIVAKLGQKRKRLESILQDLGATVVSNPVVSFVVCESGAGLEKKLEEAKVRCNDSGSFGKPGYVQLPVSADVLEGLQ
jgi:aspartate/methionine/tyrosine aminotransferase